MLQASELLLEPLGIEMNWLYNEIDFRESDRKWWLNPYRSYSLSHFISPFIIFYPYLSTIFLFWDFWVLPNAAFCEICESRTLRRGSWACRCQLLAAGDFQIPCLERDQNGPEWTDSRGDTFIYFYFFILFWLTLIAIGFLGRILVFAVRWMKRHRNKASSDIFWPRCTCAMIPAIPCAFHHDLRQWYQLWRSYETSFNDWDKVMSDLMQVRSLQEPFYSSTFKEFQWSKTLHHWESRLWEQIHSVFWNILDVFVFLDMFGVFCVANRVKNILLEIATARSDRPLSGACGNFLQSNSPRKRSNLWMICYRWRLSWSNTPLSKTNPTDPWSIPQAIWRGFMKIPCMGGLEGLGLCSKGKSP